TVLAIAEGARQSVESQIRSLGSNLMTVRPSRARIGAIRTGSVETLTRADAEALEEIPGVRSVAAESRGTAQIRYREGNLSGSAVGVTEDYFSFRSSEIARGLAFSSIADEQRARVAVVGSNVARELFGDESPIGARIQVQ